MTSSGKQLLTCSTSSRSKRAPHFGATVAICCAIAAVVGAGAARAGVNVWTSNGPYGGYVTALVIDPAAPSTLYAGTRGGVFKSTDSGSNWSAVNTGLIDRSGNTPSVTELIIDPNTPSTLYAGTWVDGLFKSTDSGGSWSGVGAGYGQITALAIDPITPSTLYVGIALGYGGAWVFQSTNGGSSWSRLDAGGLDASVELVTAFAIDPISPSTIYAGRTGVGVLKSTNSDGNWSAVNTGLIDEYGNTLSVTALIIDPTTPSTLYAATDAGVFDIGQVNACVGDCGVDGRVTVEEIITMVNIALGTDSMTDCGSGDANHDNVITVDELITAVNNELNGCG